jgi:hypothetical protein
MVHSILRPNERNPPCALMRKSSLPLGWTRQPHGAGAADAYGVRAADRRDVSRTIS